MELLSECACGENHPFKAGLEKFRELLVKYRHSRFPVYFQNPECPIDEDKCEVIERTDEYIAFKLKSQG